MRFEEAYEGWTEKRLTQIDAARLPGVCARTFRRIINRYEEDGLDGVIDTRLAQVSHRRAPVRRLTSARISADRGLFDSLLESFVYAELQKHAAWSDHHHRFYHYRDKDKVEVDFVIKRNPDARIGVEVKASATVRQEDFKGLQRLQSVAGGALLYTGDKALPFGSRLMAIPISAFWL